MLAASPALVNFLGSGEPFIGADLYVITLASGTVLYLTSLDRAVTYTGTISANPDYGTHTYLSMGQSASGVPLIQRSKVQKSISSSSKVDLTIYASPGTLILNQQILTTIAQGLWSNAQVWIRRAFILPTDVPANWNTPIPTNLGSTGDGTVVWFLGYVGSVTKLGMLSAELEIRDLLWYLNRPLPKNLYSPGCYHALYDAGCGVVKATYSRTGNFDSGSTTTTIYVPETFDQGVPVAPVWSSDPITEAGSKYTLNAATYYTVSTYLTNYGETAASAEWNYTALANALITVASPPAVTGVMYWNCYVGLEPGNEQLQQGPIAIGTNWTESGGGIDLTGVYAPNQPTSGYFALGVLTVTYNSGALSGQTYSAYIETSTWNGSSTTLTLRVPLPQAPVSTDSYVLLPGCDKRANTCGIAPSIGNGAPGSNNGKFGNLLHFGGHPYTPVPESGL